MRAVLPEDLGHAKTRIAGKSRCNALWRCVFEREVELVPKRVGELRHDAFKIEPLSNSVFLGDEPGDMPESPDPAQTCCSMPGLRTFTTTGVPSEAPRLWTCATDAAACGASLKDPNTCSGGLPNSRSTMAAIST